MVTNQVAEYDTTHDYSVGITGIPRYGFGAWPDVQDQGTKTLVVSGNGGKGLYPWVDFTTGTWGVVGVQDERGAPVRGARITEGGSRGPYRRRPLRLGYVAAAWVKCCSNGRTGCDASTRWLRGSAARPHSSRSTPMR